MASWRVYETVLGRASMKILKERSRIYCKKGRYRNIKVSLMNHVTDVSDGLLISFYVSALKPAIQLELLVSKLTSLGDAFALARVTEARLDDQRVSIVNQATTGVSGGGSQRTQSSRISAAVSQPAALSQSVKPPLLPTPTSGTFDATAKPLAIKWISPAERQKRLNKGLCFNCDNPWVCGHKCPGKFMSDEEEDMEPMTEAIQEDALEGGDILILNSLVGYGSLRSLQFWGVLGAAKGLPMDVDLYVLPRKGPDIVLGIQWLQNLGKVTHDYSNQTMEFSWSGRDYSLKGKESLLERDALLCQHTQNLLVIKHRWERQANWKRRDVEFNVGDMVLVKLQPYRQVTLAKRYCNKLAKRCYGPFKVLERVGKVAYRLALPDSSKIHPVFHVSLLKPFSGTGEEHVANLPEDEHEEQPVKQPLAICDTQIILQKGIPVR
ncbi:reverse transcriptase [Tanacetum coccineum]